MKQSILPQKLKNDLAKASPNLAFKVEWEIDEYFRWDGDGPDPVKSGYYPHDVDVTAMTVAGGELISGTDSLGGSYEKFDDVDIEIHGYLNQMLCGALEDLKKSNSAALHVIPGRSDEIDAAIKIVKTRSQLEYDKQQKDKVQNKSGT